MMLHPLQPPLDNLVGYLRDAMHIHDVAWERNRQRADERRDQGKRPGIRPPASQHSLNRAVVVAAVGAWEAFCEDLALTAQPLDSLAAPPKKNWYEIDGRYGMVQTPNSNNVQKLFWTLFRFDPVPTWSLSVRVSPRELNGANIRWRREWVSYSGEEAAAFLDAMVKVRHGFAHQDKAQKPPVRAGIVDVTEQGKITTHQHHAQNSLRTVLQLAVLTTTGLADILHLGTGFRWSRQMGEWEWLLQETPAGERIAAQWSGAPQL